MVIRPATHDDLRALLALISDYQRFYAGRAPDEAHNAAFFARFIAPSDRGMIDVARERGASHLRWWTALDNRRAQRLYERVGAERSSWFEYEIATSSII